MRRLPTAFLILSLLTLGCSDSSEVSQVELDPTDVQLVNRLVPFDDCASLLEHIKAEAAERVGPYGLDGTGYPIWLEGGVMRGEIGVLDSGPAIAIEESVQFDASSSDSSSRDDDASWGLIC